MIFAIDEPGSGLYGLGTSSQIGCAPAIVHCADTNDQGESTGERGFISFDFVYNCGEQDRGKRVAGVRPFHQHERR